MLLPQSGGARHLPISCREVFCALKRSFKLGIHTYTLFIHQQGIWRSQPKLSINSLIVESFGSRLKLSYVNKAKLNHTEDPLETRLHTGLSVDDCIELCDISKRTWYRWRSESAPKWTVRLILSQAGTLDHLGWRDDQIRGGRLYYNQLSYRYWWEPQHLVMPLYGVKNPAILKPHTDDDSLSNVVVMHKQALAG